MADTSIHKANIVNGWTISPSNGVFRAVNKHGQIGFAGAESFAIAFARDKANKATKDMNK